MELDGEIATDDANKAKLFAKFFSSVYNNHEEDADLDRFIADRNDSNTFKIIPSREAVQGVLLTMDTNKGSGTDNISPIFLRMCAQQLAEPLHILFSRSLEEGIYPDTWKIGQITPIFK